MNFLRLRLARIALVASFAFLFGLTAPSVRASIDTPAQLIHNEDGTTTLWDDGVHYTFGAHGLLAQVVGANGQSFELCYNNQGGDFPRISAIKDSDGTERASYTWNEAGTHIETIYQNGRTYNVSYETLQNGNTGVTTRCEGEVVQRTEMLPFQERQITSSTDPSPNGDPSSAKVHWGYLVGGVLLIGLGVGLAFPVMAAAGAVYYAGSAVVLALWGAGGYLVYLSDAIPAALNWLDEFFTPQMS